jgi:hypothetical protein
MKARLAIALGIVAWTAATPVVTRSAPSGLAWDSVVKLSMNADPSTLQPGDFSADYAAASTTQAPAAGGGGIFGQLHQVMSAGKSMQEMMQNGFASREYVAGSKDRIDMLAAQTAVITDCSARTITTLDLQRKTYKIVSMDQPYTQSSGKSGPSGPAASAAPPSHVAITLTSAALGPRNVNGQATSGYRADMTIAETNANGETSTQNANMLGYYSNIARPVASCAGAATAGGDRGIGAMMGNYAQVMRALAAAGIDSHFSVKQSGPPLPLGKLAMYDATTFVAEGRGSITFVTERGNIRPISAADPVFSIPAGFTQQ